MIYDGLHVVDLTTGIAGVYCAKLLTDLGADVVFVDPIHDPLFTYLRTSQRHASDVAPWLAAADMVIVGEPGLPSGVDPLVTVSITAVGHGGPDDGLVLTDEVLQAWSGSLANHGHANRPPLTVGGRLGEYVTGAYAALGAATAWTCAFVYTDARSCRRLDARSDPHDVHDRAHADGPLPGGPDGQLPLGDDPGQRAHR